MKLHTQSLSGISSSRKFRLSIPLTLILLILTLSAHPTAQAAQVTLPMQDPDPPASPAAPLTDPEVIVDEYVSDYVVTMG